MAALIIADDFRQRFDISDDIDDARIKPAIGSASRRLRQWVGDDQYQLAAGQQQAHDELRDDLKNAEAHLAMHFAICGLNYPLSSKGIVATAMSNEGREMRKYLTPEETARVEMQFLEKAREICEPYLVETQSTIEFVAGEDFTIDGSC
ncbi:MAG: hypothetical protein KIS76_03855 [Pyrinomonadaceae bacterium]|nr:hypothetical protein [Pyrinomonadaceae bacterium]